MPEYPDIEAYKHALGHHIGGKTLEALSIRHPFLLRTVDPPVSEVVGRRVVGIGRIAKQLVFHFENDCHAVLHLMIAGRLRWSKAGAKVPAKVGLAAFRFEDGTLILTEAGTKRRASLSLVRGVKALSPFDPGGVDVFGCTAGEFHLALARENHTLKRALTDQRLVAGIGNAYSDEILHAARMSPFVHSSTVSREDASRLLEVCRFVLSQWQDRLTPADPNRFPTKVTAFHPEMSVHGRYGLPCRVCGTPVQRIQYAENEANYCPTCQTGGKIYSDRALARLLKDDWPRTVEQMQALESRNAARSAEADRRGSTGAP